MHAKRNRSEESADTEYRSTVLVILMFISFVLCCGPIFIVNSWYALTPESVPLKALVISRFLAALNSVLNPFLYGFISKEIRSNVWGLWKGLFKRMLCRAQTAEIVPP